MRRYLLPEGTKSYKANLHSHSVISDGKLTPAEAKRLYKSRGYSVLAITDHDVMIPHSELSDSDFLMLSGYELEFKEEYGSTKKHCHLTLIAPEAHSPMAAAHRSKYLYGNSRDWIDRANILPGDQDYERTYSAESVNGAINIANSRGYFITYNHPAWSMESFSSLASYRGLSAIEIMNTNSSLQGFPEENARLYDDMLRAGHRLGVIAADDNHNEHPTTSKACDSFRSYTVIKAKSLSYQSVFGALKSGNYYASEGPEIRALYAEDGSVHVKTSAADSITFNTATRHSANFMRTGFDSLNSASFTPLSNDTYVRITVTDAKGKKAYTRAYFLDELG